MDATAEEKLPLTHLSLEILMALLEGELHGYGIIKAVRGSSTSGGSLRTGTFYSALRRLQQEELVEEAEEQPGEAGDERRRYYRITSLGRSVLEAEVRRLDAVVTRVRTFLPSPAAGGEP
jgi:DNA-binding PadR family transcriptional regulator